MKYTPEQINEFRRRHVLIETAFRLAGMYMNKENLP